MLTHEEAIASMTQMSKQSGMTRGLAAAPPRLIFRLLLLLLWVLPFPGTLVRGVASAVVIAPKRILVDTDADSDDIYAILYLLKQSRSEIDVTAITISTNAWSNAGHAVNHIYDVLDMMGRDDISVGVGGEGGIDFEGNIYPNVGGYLPLIDQSLSTVGGCRYRQAIPPGPGGLLDTDSLYGIRREFLPQGNRRYHPITQPTSQDVMLETLLSGPTIVILLGSHTNFAALLMSHPEVKTNVQHIYIMGGGINSSNPANCCPEGSTRLSCRQTQCGIRGNLFDAVSSNPWAEFNVFSDPFAAYQVLHSGIPLTLVPLDATNTIPITEHFLSSLEENQLTFEAQYVFQSLKLIRDTWFNDHFFQSFFMWDSFTTGIAVSDILNNHDIKKNEFAFISHNNITVVTCNKPYEIQDGSNPFFDNRSRPKFNLQRGGIHSGHVQTGLEDPFCLVPNGKGICMDGYTMETSNPLEAVRIQVAEFARPNPDIHSRIQFAFAERFLEMINSPQNTARYNFKTQFPCYKGTEYKLINKAYGMPVVFDMDMSPGDFITLFYLLKTSRELIDLKAITVTATGWANGATIDIIYDVLHMMGRDDIPVGLGDLFAINEAYPPFNNTGNCKYRQSIPNGAAGFIDSDTLFGLARDLPRSPRRYTAENSVKYGAPRDTDHPELRQPLAQEVFNDVLSSLGNNSAVTILTSGPLTNIAKFLASTPNVKSRVQALYITGGSIHRKKGQLGNVFTIPENTKAEFNMFLDPKAAKEVLESGLRTTLIPLDVLHKNTLSRRIARKLEVMMKTPEAAFVHRILQTIKELQKHNPIYLQTEKLVAEVLGAVVMVHEGVLKSGWEVEPMSVMASGHISTDGWTRVDAAHGHPIRYLRTIHTTAVAAEVVRALTAQPQTAVIASFQAQTLCSSSVH